MRMTSTAVMSKTGAVLRLVRGLPVVERRVSATSTGRIREKTNKEEICELFGLNNPANRAEKIASLKSSEVDEHSNLESLRGALYAK